MSGDEFIDGDPFSPADTENFEAVQAKRQEISTDAVRRALMRRQEAYRRVFIGNANVEDVQLVLTDLKAFCRGGTTTFHENERISVLLQGRQEVWLRVEDHTRLSFDELFVKYSRVSE